MNSFRTLLLPLLAALLAWFAISLTRPPEPLTLDAEPSEFSAARAIKHIEIIADAPRPTGSSAIYKVRNYLVQELNKLGLETQVMRSEVLAEGMDGFRSGRSATVENIVARLPGQNPKGKALMLLAHYDSRENTKGASDDGQGVATILETLRALASLPPLANDLIVLFSDGEEVGLFGAQAFANSEIAEEVGLALNFEARGSSGPVLLFETSDGNGALLDEFAKAAPLPLADSLNFAIYRAMSNDTDLTIFREAQIPGLNFGYIEGFYDYHTMGDNVDNINPASVQHSGSYALSLTRHFGQLSLPIPNTENKVYFNPIGKLLLGYSLPVAYALGCLVLIGFAGIVRNAHRLGLIHYKQLATGLGAFLTVLLAVAVWVQASHQLLFAMPNARSELHYVLSASTFTLFTGYLLMTLGLVIYVSQAFVNGVSKISFTVFGVLTLSVSALSGHLALPLLAASILFLAFIWWRLNKQLTVLAVYYGGLCTWALCVLLMLLLLSDASHVVVWPMAVALLFEYVRLAKTKRASPSWWLPVVGGSYCFILFSPIIKTMHNALGFVQPFAAMILVTLACSLWLLPFLQSTSTHRRWLGPSVLSFGVILVFALPMTNPFNNRLPEPNEVFYYQDADSQEAFWVTSDRNAPVWAETLFTKEQSISISRLLPGYDSPILASSTESGNLFIPFIEGKEVLHRGNKRYVSFTLHSPNRAEYVNLFFSNPKSIHSAALNGQQIALSEYAEGSFARWRYYGLPEQGIRLDLEIEQDAEVTLKVVEIAWRWPEPLLDKIPERPKDQMPRPFSYSDASVISKGFSL